MMADLFPLHIFPTGSLDSSVITTVWAGVMVVAFFNMRFGWSLTGLVVPGYLVPLLMIKPWSVAVIIGEGVVTYLLVWGFSTLGGRWLGLADFFGRDRFFALVLISVVVRLLFDAFWLPALGSWLNQQFGLHFDYLGNLHSFGLVIVALIANSFWKPGLARGMLWLLVTLVVTFILVRFGLMELTNFSASSLSYLYEDIASSLLASPKAYIILLTTAFIASRLNLHYAWEFNGILIPSLLALQWYQPSKLLTTFIEVGVILASARLLLMLPWFANVNLTGARKLLFFFNVAFVYKLGLGLVLERYFPHVKATDYFAFGYLIATLLAVKIHDRDIGIRVTRATLQTSLMAAVAASCVGFALTLLPVRLDSGDQTMTAEYGLTDTPSTLEELLLQERVAGYGTVEHTWLPQPTGLELSRFQSALEHLESYLQQGERQSLQQAQQILAQLQYEVIRVEERFLLLREQNENRGWGTFVLDTRHRSGLLVAVPEALSERGMTGVGLALFLAQDATALAVGGSGSWGGTERLEGAVTNPGSLFHQFHQYFGRDNSLQVRRVTREATRHLHRLFNDMEGPLAGNNYLLVKQELPQQLKLDHLQRALGRVVVHWGTLGDHNVQRQRADKGFAELYVQPDSARLLLARSQAAPGGAEEVEIQHERLAAYLQKQEAAELLEPYQPPRLNELIFVDHEILTPMLRLLEGGSAEDPLLWQQQLNYLNSLARSIGYRIVRLRGPEGRFVLLEPMHVHAQDWGTLVLRLDKRASEHLIQVPRPRLEYGSLAVGLELFQALDARALMLAGRARQPDPDKQADVLQPSNRDTLFNLMHQVLLRETGNQPLTLVQVRGMSEAGAGEVPAILALRADESRQVTAFAALRSALVRTRLDYQLVDGDVASGRYDIDRDALTRYLPATRNKALAVLWVAPEVRRALGGARQERLAQQYRALGIATQRVALGHYLASRTLVREPLPNPVLRLLTHYAQTEDILALNQLIDSGLSVEELVDIASGRRFLLVLDRSTEKTSGVLLQPGAATAEVMRVPGFSGAAVQAFIERNASMLLPGGEA